ncbi:MAG: protein translocase subunit SecD [Tepidisphaera sp.]|nr:protein translocase subunit SecD [Tepidisphaera sp.]
MLTRQMIRNGLIVIAAIALCVWNIIPPEKQLRLGKDLRGGVSLIYTVSIDSGENASDTMTKTIDALRKRVDPDGLLEISMAAQGRDRIEISMPLPSEHVKVLRKKFEDALAQLGKAQVTDARVDQAVRTPGADRDKAIAELAGGSDRREELLKAAAAKYDELVAKHAAYDAAKTDAEKESIAPQVAAAEIAYDAAKKAVLTTALSAEEIRHVVNASVRRRSIVEGKDVIELPSEREVAEQRLREAHPESGKDIDRLLGLYNDYAKERTTLDDPNDLIRMLKGAGVLSFRIAVEPGKYPQEAKVRQELRERGPQNVKASDVRWFKINQIENWITTKAEAEAMRKDPDFAPSLGKLRSYVVGTYNGEAYMLCWDVRNARLTPAEGSWAVASARPGTDQLGKPDIQFEMNANGARLLGELTRQHVKEPMAVLLDDEVYTAPTLQSEISASGQISGDFDEEEIRYIVRVLAGGSLQAKLSPEPISISSVGPELGADNLRQGLRSGVIAISLVAGFMVVYYFGCGFVAVLALLVNSILILGAMSFAQAAFTMPGIAGVILTFGMAVDSNVLIYERMREEMLRGADLKTAVRLGFDKALASIVDGNVTNLIVCVVLYYTGTPEIRGFSIAMGVGVVATLFAALVFSRLIFHIMLAAGWRKTSMLPMAIPAIQRAITPHFNWLRWRYVFIGISATYVSLGLIMVFVQGKKLLDNEFLGGTQVTLQLKSDGHGGHVMMKRQDVDERVKQIARDASPDNELRKLDFAEVFPVEPQSDGVTSDRFIIKTVAENSKAVLGALTEAFADQMDTRPPLSFTGSNAVGARAIPAFPIEKPLLGQNIDRPLLRQDVKPFMGGVAIVLDKIDPPTSLDQLQARLRATRETADFSDTLSRTTSLIPIDGSDNEVKSAVLLVQDPSASIFDNEAKWDSELKTREWALVTDALTKETSPASVHNFSATIASTFRTNAIVASLMSFVFIGIYIWVRFKAPRYSIAAVVALVHDVLTVLGLLAIASVLYEWQPTHDIAARLGLLPFKIDLNTVAALLTIAGYSLNDTVIVMDRIRENRGKLPYATSTIINDSINQTFSRTLITGGTTLTSCIILYLFGGEGMRTFAFALTTGLIVGTYSSVAVAAPIVWSRRFDRDHAASGGGTPPGAVPAV